MRTRVVKTASGNYAIQVVSKANGHVTVHKHIGTYITDLEKERLLEKAREYILAEFDNANAQQTKLFSDIPAAWPLGEVEIINSQPLYLYNLLVQAYDKLGFGGDPLVRDLVISRLYKPTSKRETDEILNDIFDRPYSLRTIYRHLKVAISKGLKDQYQQALINYARVGLNDSLHLVFYDVTTLAFASGTKTTLKDFGYSKDHRSQDTRVVVGLVVNQQGFPLYFDVFSGNTFKGGTFTLVAKGIQKLLNCPELVVVADAGMLSQKNMDDLDKEGIKFVVGARISSLSQKMTSELSQTLGKTDKASTEIAYKNYRLLADYSDKRAKKDAYDLTKQWERAQKAMAKPDAITRRTRHR